MISAVEDLATGVRTVRARFANGELVTIAGHAESGTGYLLRGNGG